MTSYDILYINNNNNTYLDRQASAIELRGPVSILLGDLFHFETPFVSVPNSRGFQCRQSQIRLRSSLPTHKCSFYNQARCSGHAPRHISVEQRNEFPSLKEEKRC